MFKDTLRANILCSLLTATERSGIKVLYMQSGDFPSNFSPDCSLPLVFEDIKKNNINLVLLKD